MKTKVFISQADGRSRALAERLKVFVRQLTHTDPWTSSEIPKGANWPQALAERLRDAGAGMACLTPENLTNEWILFGQMIRGRQIVRPSHCPSRRSLTE
jgi:hypothetical protein